MPGDYNWKRWVAESELGVREIARKCGKTPQYVSRVRKEYRGELRLGETTKPGAKKSVAGAC